MALRKMKSVRNEYIKTYEKPIFIDEFHANLLIKYYLEIIFLHFIFLINRIFKYVYNQFKVNQF